MKTREERFDYCVQVQVRPMRTGGSQYRACQVTRDGRQEFVAPFGHWRDNEVAARTDAKLVHSAVRLEGIPFRMDPKLREAN